MKILATLEKTKACWYFLSILLFFFLLRLPSLFEPHWYGDEGIYQTVGLAVREGRLLYRDIWDNKPPLLYLVYALFSSDQFSVRLFSLIVGAGALVVFFLLAKKLFSSQRIVFLQTALFCLLFATPILEGNIANAENFMLLPILLSALLIAGKKEEVSARSSVAAGLLLALSFLIKVVAIFDVAAFSLFLLFTRLRLFFLFLFAFAFAVPIGATVVYFALNGAFSDLISASLTQNVGYVGYANQFLVSQGLLFLKSFILLTFVFFLFLKRRQYAKPALFVLLWLAFSAFNAFFSQRPYTHYLLVLLPSFLLTVGLALERESKFQNVKTLSASLTVILLLLLASTFRLYDKTFAYYQNFLDYVTMRKSTFHYQAFFDRSTPKDYEIAQFVRARTTEQDLIFVWGNNAQVYKLANRLAPGRFTVAYHARATRESLAETEKSIERKKPKYIIVTTVNDPIPFALSGYRERLTIRDALIYERVH